MPRTSDLAALVSSFASQLEAIVTRRANEEFAARFDGLKAQILSGSKTAPVLGLRRPGRPVGSKSRRPADSKPCPVCGTLTKARRYSYLCEDHRTPENITKFRGSAAKAAAPKVKRGPGRPRKNPLPAAPAPKVKRGPGRPPKAAAAA
jgi:hypothetical protein